MSIKRPIKTGSDKFLWIGLVLIITALAYAIFDGYQNNRRYLAGEDLTIGEPSLATMNMRD